MHCYFSDGIANKEIALLYQESAALKYDFKKIMHFCNSGWLPKCPLFIRPDGIKGGASEVLRAVPLLRHFLVKDVKPSGLLADQIASFEAPADVVKQMQKIKLLSSVPDSAADELQRLQALHFTAFKNAYGAYLCVPKHHYSIL